MKTSPSRPVPPGDCLDCPLRGRGSLRNLDEETVRSIEAARIGARYLRDGDMVCREGEASLHAFAMFDGYALRYRLLPGGERQVLQFVLAGDFLSAIGQAEPKWTETIEVVDHAVLCVFDGPTLSKLFERKIEMAHAIAQIQEAEKSMLKEHVTDLGQRPGIERVARLLLELFSRQRSRGLTIGDRCFLPFTQEQLGDAVGLTAVHVSRVHSYLRRAGLMSLERRWLVVPSYERAAREFGFDPAFMHEPPLI